MWFAFAMSRLASTLSFINHIKSNLDNKAGGTLMFSPKDSFASYFPNFGFAAASILVFAGSVRLTPATALDTVCCSMASCIELRSSLFILSNSSINANPPEHNGNTPACAIIVPSASLTIPIVSPAADVPLPLVYIDVCVIFLPNFNSSDFAILGSPTRRMLMSPRLLPLTPPASCNNNDSFISLYP